MGNFTETVILKNAGDIIKAKGGLIKENEIRQVTVQAIPDTGASRLYIDEETRVKLGLEVEDAYKARIVDGKYKKCKMTEAVQVHWKDRFSICRAAVMPGIPSILLGAIPLEDMDLRVNPAEQRLEYAHGEVWAGLAL
jgi:predicted aspartyl protease